MNTLNAILQRQSCRAYSDQQITEDELQLILTAANAAPVGMGMFDCMALTVIQGKELLSKIDANAAAGMGDPASHPLYGAPTCILVSVKKEEGPFAAMHPLSAACIMENMMVQASDLGLSSTFLMGATVFLGQNPELCEAAKVPEGFIPAAIAAIGHSAEPETAKTATTDKIKTARV